ncbi:putative SNF2-family protein [Waddlia chondrophila 2032/99]|uniref:Putative SNF2-family protein n=1 Tax=Waddlia chondrophila 2032/99 TaxID=765953 RepID=F8LF25_9BACT|nr:putative SNF2-family protein [Waddlia chondrophila 2032/99]
MASKLPEKFQPFKEEALKLLSETCVAAMEFSGGTYQVQIVLPKEGNSVWSFIQFDDKHKLKDCFCSCEDRGDVAACPHLAAALLAIYGSHRRPLHVRFERSFWHALAQIAYQEFGDDLSMVSRQGKLIRIGSFCEIMPLTEKGEKELRERLLERPVETEETSLKFSNLSIHEIQRWKEGRPSRSLSFELSFWNDLAHWLMLEQELNRPFEVTFNYDEEGFPSRINVFFTDMEGWIEIDRKWWPDLVPVLESVNAPLVVQSMQESIKAITFDDERLQFQIVPGSMDRSDELISQGVVVGQWIYLPKVGFYLKEKHPLLLKSLAVEEVLDQYGDLVAELMTSKPLHLHPMDVAYDLSFDSEWNLQIKMTLPGVGMLDAIFGHWGYSKTGGFFYLDGVIFNRVKTEIEADKVVSFVSSHKHWLDQQPGFQIHLAGIETTLVYEMSDKGELTLSRAALIEDGEEGKDFGQWVYLKERGFYPKSLSHLQLPIEDQLVIPSAQLPFFLRKHREDLEAVPGMFSQNCPVKQSGLKVELLNPETIIITPMFKLHDGVDPEHIQYFEEFVYQKGKGFAVLPPELRLPDRFMHIVTITKDAFPAFLTLEIEQMKDSILELDPQLRRDAAMQLVIEAVVKKGKAYEVNAYYQTTAGRISVKDICETLKSGRRFLFSNAGLVDTKQARFQWMKEASVGEPMRLMPLDLIRLAAFDPPTVLSGKGVLDELISSQTAIFPDCSLLKSQLRPYQELGVKWLWFLYQSGLSGLLCDDMGLGKTHQSMALIAAARKSQVRPQPFLIVCPTSVIYHWEDKLKEFLPQLTVRTFHGTGRSMEGFHKEDDILLTSYGIWRREVKALSKIRFDAAIFDEIQSAKNQKSRIHLSLKDVRANVKVGLTGTPIENRLRELKSLFDLILPGYMMQEKAFRDFFVIPIEKEKSQERRELLSRFIKPFILRRRKEEVLLDLPEKVEQVAHCELSLDQKILYAELLDKMRGNLIRELNDQTSPIPYLHVFSLLSSLKQICNHPAAYLKNPVDYDKYQSGKWELFKELISEALESDQKVVVFSQYLAMLDIMQQYLDEQRIGYATIRGATLDRGEVVRRFNADSRCKVFLGSLQAAGLGIDLTAASVVIHYDRWWNAAREDQATDRVHRIGQQRGVQVFKLVTLGTFEERIDEMITRKGRLMEEVIGVDDHRFMKAFDRQELIELLSFTGLEK